MCSFLVQFIQLALIFLIAAPQARAYVDPGSGSLLLQFLLAAGVGVLFQFRRTFSRLKLRWWK